LASSQKTLLLTVGLAFLMLAAVAAWLSHSGIDVRALTRSVLLLGPQTARYHAWQEVPVFTRFQLAWRYETTGEDEPFFQDSLATVTPAAMLDFLEIRHPFCHGAAHDLGAAVLAKTQDVVKALDTCGTRCTNGCMHGVLGQAFAQPAGNKEGGAIVTPDALCAQDAVLSRYKPGNCAHAVGHALMKLSAAKPDRALSQCARFTDHSMEYYCATGVFMSYEEQWEGDDTPVTPATGPPRALPCAADLEFPAACYRYFLPRLSAENNPTSEQLRAHCLSLPDRQRPGCFHGLGAFVIDEVGENPAVLTKVCGQGSEADRALCIEGAIEKLSDHDPASAERACGALSGEDKQVCLAAAHDGMYRLTKPTMKYYLDGR